jgi:hypothetical protein
LCWRNFLQAVIVAVAVDPYLKTLGYSVAVADDVAAADSRSLMPEYFVVL